MFATPAMITVRRVALCPLRLFTEEMVGPAGRVVGVDFSEPTIQVMERAGVPRGTVERLPRSAREAGLEIAEADGFFATQDPAIGFEIHAGSLAAVRERAIEAGIAAEMIDDVVAILRAAKAGGYEWVT
jgi:hypothetical protein